jgi:heterogeneous nuclear ribonucleoprotein U-like protein 1
MASSVKHERPELKTEEEPETKRPRLPTDSVTQRVQLNPADCNLDFDIEHNGLEGHALHHKGFAYCWSGARATVGIRGGKYCFACKVIATQPVDMEDTPSDQQHVSRVGISRGDDTVGNLGETEHSFGFGGTGKFSTAGKFSDYGSKFSVGDTIVCAVNLESRPLAELMFQKNGTQLGVAKRFDSGPKGLGVTDTPLKKLSWESAIFPHVLLKNVVVQMQFSIEDGLVPPEGYKPWSEALQDGNGLIGPQFSSKKECEVIMMVGLPAAGKTTWAEKWTKDHPDKRYMVLGTNLALDQMKVPGLLRKQNYGERFDRLMDRATGIFNTLLDRATKTARNYILDQTNVYKSARKRKLRAFVDYRKIAVVIFPRPEEIKVRSAKRFKEMGKEVPADAVNEMLANYVIPTSKDMPGSDEVFDEVWFPELTREEAQKILVMDKSELKVSSMSKSRDNSPYMPKSRDNSPYMPKSRDNSPYMPKSRDNSPYPRAGSVPSVTGPRASAAPSGSWRGSEEPSMDRNMYNYNSPQAVDHYRRADPNSPLPGNNFYGNSRNTFQRNDIMDPRGLAPYRDTGSPYSANTYRDTGSPYSANAYREPPYRESQYRDPASPYSVNIGPGYAPPPISSPYGMPDPGRSQTRPLMPPGPSPMQPHPGWGNRPY